MIISDLHIHSRFAQGTSKNITIRNLSEWAKKKGLNLIGTGDFTHPEWIKEIKEEIKKGFLKEENGLLRSKDDVYFLFQTEISLMYSQGGKGRRVHHVVIAPSLEVVENIIEELLKIGRLDYDGRPIFGVSSIEFVELMRNISKDIEIIPAHIWTPWYGLLGSKSGFDSVEEAFEDLTKYIHALETGLSSDPPMNWRLSSLDRFNLVSFSDSHSYWPWRLGREATVFNTEFNYKAILNAIRTGKGLEKTLEVDPNYGKYHYDGHRNCNLSLSPKESKKYNYICPICHKPLTIGVLNRVEELSDREDGFKPNNAKDFLRILPLSEIISAAIGKSINSKIVWELYNKLMKLGKSEIDVLLNIPINKIYDAVDYKIARAIELNRDGKIRFKPGYDGFYGIPIFEEEIRESNKKYKKDSYKKKFKDLLDYF